MGDRGGKQNAETRRECGVNVTIDLLLLMLLLSRAMRRRRRRMCLPL